MSIGSLYNTKGVVVGQAAGFYAPENTPLPADVAVAFDEATWLSTTVAVTGTPTGGTAQLLLSGGPISGIITANIPYNATASGVKAVLDPLLPAGVVSVVNGGPGPGTAWVIAFVGSAAGQIIVAKGTNALTGGSTPNTTVTSPLWTPAGATEQGWQNNYNPQTQDINIEEQQTSVGRKVTTATFDFTANLSEDTVASLKLALGAARTVQASDSTHFAVEELSLQQDLPVLAVALETANKYGMPRRYYIPGATCAVNVGQQFARARVQRLVPVTFSSVCNVEDIRIREITGPPTP